MLGGVSKILSVVMNAIKGTNSFGNGNGYGNGNADMVLVMVMVMVMVQVCLMSKN